jgi:hypothetical protein
MAWRVFTAETLRTRRKRGETHWALELREARQENRQEFNRSSSLRFLSALSVSAVRLSPFYFLPNSMCRRRVPTQTGPRSRL